MKFPKIFRTFVTDADVDLTRRGFIFGAAASAALIVPAPKSFFIMPAPKLIVPQVSGLKFDLPLQQMLSLMQKLEQQLIEVSAIPRWVVVNKDLYDEIVGAEHLHANGLRGTGISPPQGRPGRSSLHGGREDVAPGEVRSGRSPLSRSDLLKITRGSNYVEEGRLYAGAGDVSLAAPVRSLG